MEYKIRVTPTTTRWSQKVEFYAVVYMRSDNMWHSRVVSGLRSRYVDAKLDAIRYIMDNDAVGWDYPKGEGLEDYPHITGAKNDVS